MPGPTTEVLNEDIKLLESDWAGKLTADVQNLKSDAFEIKQLIRELGRKVGGNDVQKRS